MSNNQSKRARRHAKKKEIKAKKQEEAAQASSNTQDSATDTTEYQQHDDEMIAQGQSSLNFIEQEDGVSISLLLYKHHHIHTLQAFQIGFLQYIITSLYIV